MSDLIIDTQILKPLKGKDFVTTRTYSKDEIEQLIYLAMELKRQRATKRDYKPLDGKTLALLFKKLSTRTRTSFQVGIAELGGTSLFLRSDELQLGRGEPISDTARVLDKYLSGLVVRTFEHEELEEYAKYMRAPVINALTDLEHPTQVLADLMTIKEIKGKWKGLKIVYTGDPWNVAHSLILELPRFGMDFTLALPDGYFPNNEIWEVGKKEAKKNGTSLEISNNLKDTAKDADVIIGNTWWSMGKPETEKDKRKIDFQPFSVTKEVMNMAKNDAIFMHCLPAYRGNEMTEEVIEGRWSVVWQEAENRLHTIKAILATVIP
jgi:ornithine carbamoyltransferase